MIDYSEGNLRCTPLRDVYRGNIVLLIQLVVRIYVRCSGYFTLLCIVYMNINLESRHRHRDGRFNILANDTAIRDKKIYRVAEEIFKNTFNVLLVLFCFT